MIFDNQFLKIYDVSFYQTVMFDYIDRKRIPLPIEKQKHIDFLQMHKKALACIIKVGQRNYPDPAFEISWKNAKKAGMLRGSYWFCDKFDTPKNQARLYWSLIKNDMPEGVVAVDFETGSWNDLNNLYVFMNELQQISGLPDERILLYTNYYFFMEATQNAKREWFSQFPLWIASYTSNPEYVKIPPMWKEVLLWQYGTPTNENAGVHSLEIDGNFFNGGMEKFEKYFGKVEGGEIDTPNPIETKPIEIFGIYGNEKIKYTKET